MPRATSKKPCEYGAAQCLVAPSGPGLMQCWKAVTSPPPRCTPCNLVGTPASSPAWVCVLCAWCALIGVTSGEEFSLELPHVP